MLIIPPGHAETLRARRRLSKREIWMISGVLAAVVVLAVVLVISFATSTPSSRSGCIYATIPAATGAQQVNECGATARSTCATVLTPGAFTAQAAHTLASECRKAGLRVG
jgi:predicted membrane-bound mannosyltransferase